jgi:hypothetical protein
MLVPSATRGRSGAQAPVWGEGVGSPHSRVRRPAGWGCVRTRGSPPRPRRSPGCGARLRLPDRARRRRASASWTRTELRLAAGAGTSSGSTRRGTRCARFRPSRLASDLADEGEGSEPPDGFRAALLDRAGGEVRAAMQVLVREALVVPEVQDRLGAVVEHEHLAVLGTGASCWGRRAGPGRASGGRPAGPGSGRGGRGRAVAIPLPRPEATPRVTTM